MRPGTQSHSGFAPAAEKTDFVPRWSRPRRQVPPCRSSCPGQPVPSFPGRTPPLRLPLRVSYIAPPSLSIPPVSRLSFHLTHRLGLFRSFQFPPTCLLHSLGWSRALTVVQNRPLAPSGHGCGHCPTRTFQTRIILSASLTDSDISRRYANSVSRPHLHLPSGLEHPAVSNDTPFHSFHDLSCWPYCRIVALLPSFQQSRLTESPRQQKR